MDTLRQIWDVVLVLWTALSLLIAVAVALLLAGNAVVVAAIVREFRADRVSAWQARRHAAADDDESPAGARPVGRMVDHKTLSRETKARGVRS